jgi:hypothetical protein
MGYTGTVRGRPLVVGLATVALAGVGLSMPTSAAPAPSTTEVTLTSGTSTISEWTVVNDNGTVNGTPNGGPGTDTGGDCPTTQLPGLGVEEGDYDVNGVNNGDAFDGGLLFFVNGAEVVAPTNWDVQPDPVDNTLNRVLTSGPTTVGGVGTTVEYRALPNQQVLRSTVSLSNPGSTAVTIPVAVATNFGSDSGTVTVGTSSGDAVLTDADRWLVTSDDATTPGDAVNTSVLAGPGQVAAPPTATSSTVFDCANTNGVQATYHVTIPAGSTRALMFFNELSETNAGALAGAARFNGNPGATDELLTGLSATQRANIVNWRLAEAQQPDGKIRKLHSTDYLGNNIYNTTARRQTVKTTAHRGDLRKFKVRVYNDGNTTSAFAAHGVQSARGVRVKYIVGGVNVTAAMNSAAGFSFTRAPGAFVKIKVKVRIKGSAAHGSRKFAKVLATGTASGFTKIDAVKGVVKVR